MSPPAPGPDRKSRREAMPVLMLSLAAAIGLYIYQKGGTGVRDAPPVSRSQPPPPGSATAHSIMPPPGEALLDGYADPGTPPIEDLRKIHRVIGGYFSVIKDSSRFPIGGNADLAAALRGENPNRETFIRPQHPVFNAEGLLIDRWDTPLVVHPEGWRRIELRSAGPDRVPYTGDDLILSPTGISGGH